jgi:hypothetical protein
MAKTPKSSDAVETVRTQAFAVIAGRQFVGTRLRGVDGIAGASLAEQPLTIYDLNGAPLFHDYALLAGSTTVGSIRCAANRRLGSPIISISHALPGWTPDAAVRMATESLHAMHPTARPVSTQLVCYAYPKIGLRVNYELPGKKGTQSEIFDASSGRPIGSSAESSNQFTRYSLLDRVPANDVTRRRSRFADSERQLDRLKQEHPHLFSTSVVKPAASAIFTPSKLSPFQMGTRQGQVLLSPYCPGSPPGLTHYAQILDYFCVDASAQMLLEHYGYNYTQSEIAVAMGTTAAQGGTSGTGLTTGFTSLTNNTLILSFDNAVGRAQQFQDAMAEIDANRPLFTQVPHHYRVCMGYYENTLDLLFVTLGMNQMIYIYDPWPWNPDLCQAGAPYWEVWSTSPVMWFGIVHHA